ncbi:MAG: hypothetical protein IKY66_04655 [Bacteroidales bacterium]|nr:hypothetical protein [Bacteroidales bacterium]
MKKIYLKIMSVALAFAAMVGCDQKEEPFFTATEDDLPRILNTDIPEWINGAPAVLMTIKRDAAFNFEVVVTPADYTTVSWYLDDVKIHEGKTIEQNILAGDYILKIVAVTTKGNETSRTTRLVVQPLDNDPVPGNDVLERLVSPGFEATLGGTNMDKVAKVAVGDKEADAVYADGKVTYTVPEGIADGRYPLTVKDNTGFVYGAGYITVSSSPTVSAAAFTGKSESSVTIGGKNLDKVAAVTINGQACEITEKTLISVTFTTPALNAGEYVMTAVDQSGAAVKFIQGSSLVESAVFTVTPEVVLWEGHHYVSWALGDGDPNKTFSDLAGVSTCWKPGQILRVHLEVKTDDEYHQVQFNTMWWTQLPGTQKADFGTDTVFEITITQEILDLLNAQNGFIICGHGFYVTKVTLE